VSEIKGHAKIERGSERSFGIVFCIFFSFVGLCPLLDSGGPRLWSLILAFILLMLSYLAPKTLSIPNKLWFKLGWVLGLIIAPILMALVYFVTVVPTGLIMKLLGKDLVGLKFDKNAKSYWLKRNKPVSTMKNQF